MIFKEALERSIAIFLLRTLDRFCSYLEHKIVEIYQDSYMYHLVNRCIEAVEKGNPPILWNSRFARWIADSYKKLQKAMVGHLKKSLSEDCARSIKKEFSLSPLKAVGIILIFMVVVNLMLSVIFHHKLGTLGLIIRGILLMIAFVGLLCDADWATTKRSSVVLKILFR